MLGVRPGRSTLLRQLFLPRCPGSGQQQASFVVTADPFGAPPASEPRRVVVTGLGLVSPLGVGVQRSWEALLGGHVGTQALTPEYLPKVITCHVVLLWCVSREHSPSSYCIC